MKLICVIKLLGNLENLRANLYKVFNYDDETTKYATFSLFYFCVFKVVLGPMFYLFR